MPSSLKLDTISLRDLPPNSSIPSTEKRPPVVLVVDDEQVIADTLSIILGRSGFSAITAYDAASALDTARVIPPELLLSDVMMGPGMDGTELAIELMKMNPSCRVLLFSGHAATRDLLDKAEEEGHMFTLLNKPLHPADLLVRIRESLAGAAQA